jgi:transcriptional antiterminator NusG
MRDQIFQVLVPVEEEVSFSTDGNKKQKKRTIKRKIYPGYVLIRMKMTDKSWYVVRNTPGVTGFVSPGLKPVPLPADEVEKIKQLMGLSAPVKVNIELEVGQVVRITSGALQDRTGTVVEVNPESEKVRILVNMFGRETPTTVELGQVEKI